MEDKLRNILKTHNRTRGNLITLLQQTQSVFGYVPEEAVAWFSREIGVPESRFFGIITFYSQFHRKPVGRNRITVCCGSACHIKGSDRILQSMRSALSLSPGEDTTGDLSFTVQSATCIGACSIAPVVLLDQQVHGSMDPETAVKLIKGFQQEGEYTGFEYD